MIAKHKVLTENMDNQKMQLNQLLILRTDIKTRQKVKIIEPFLDNHPLIINWSVDTEDIDNVLRIEIFNGINENDIAFLLKKCGFYGTALEN